MFFGVHLLTGAALGAIVKDPLAASGLAVVSHYTIDHLPHWNYLPKFRSKWEDSWKMGLEPVISGLLFISLAVIFRWNLNILIAAAAAALPDLIEASQYFLRSRILHYHSRFHHFGHWHARFLPSLPIVLSIIVLAVLSLPWTR